MLGALAAIWGHEETNLKTKPTDERNRGERMKNPGVSEDI